MSMSVSEHDLLYEKKMQVVFSMNVCHFNQFKGFSIVISISFEDTTHCMKFWGLGLLFFRFHEFLIRKIAFERSMFSR